MTVPQLTTAGLFQPAPSGVGPYYNGVATVPLVPPSGSWLAIMLNLANQVQLPTTSWQPGAPERTIFAVEAVCFSQSDANISTQAQGGFLQTAATGTVTYTTVNGTTVTVPVTPDPSNTAQNPTGAPGWLDLLSVNQYDVERLAATPATGPLAIANLGGSTVGPYSVGTYHVENVQTGATYSNPSALSIPTSVISGTGGVVTGVSPGMTTSVITTQSAHGLTAGVSVYLAIPTTSGINGLSGVFAIVTAATTSTFQVAVGSSGTWTAGGNVYLCTVATMQADLVGLGSNAGPGQVSVAVTQNANVYVDNILGWSGSNWETNQSLLNRCILSLAARSPNGAAQAYVYFAETAQQLLAAATPSYSLTNGPVTASAYGNPQTGVETVVVASTTPNSIVLGQPVTPGCVQLPITGVSNALPAVITCAAATSLGPGQSMTVTISGVLGTGGVVGTFLGTYVGADSFSIPVNTTSTGSYTGGGTVEGGDLGQIDALIQQNVTPDNTTSITTSALAFPLTVVATVVVPAVYVTAYQLAVQIQLAAQIASYPVGGSSETDPTYSIPWDDILAALEEAGVVALGQPSYVRAVQSLSVSGNSMTVTSSGTGVPFPSSAYQALLAPASISVVGV
jgi:hypothetical protein